MSSARYPATWFLTATVCLIAGATSNADGATNTHWAFVAPQKSALPNLGEESNRNPIDHFVRAELRDRGLAPSAEADPRTLIRRVAFDLTGLPPTPMEVEAFIQDTRLDAYLRMVRKYLDSPRYGEHMAVSWLEAARYADTSGYQHDFYRSVYPWRTWVIRAFNSNMPFDQFVAEQLAGDLLPSPTPEQKLATCFVRLHRLNAEFGAINEEFYVENVVDRVETVSTVFLGLTVGCARCHDHKFDPISMQDFYGLFGLLNNGEDLGTDPAGLHKRPYSEPVLQYPDVDQVIELSALRAELAELEQQESGDENSKKQAVDLKDRIAAIEKQVPAVMIMKEREERRPAYMLTRGSYQSPGDEVAPQTPAVLPGMTDDLPRNRLGLARWLTADDNPLLARVTVNRLWQQFFGTGLVKTTEDLGVQGEPPSHPELLDWLAVEFIESGWDIKHLVELIVTSGTYRQSSVVELSRRELDPENRRLSRGPEKRLSGFAIRDQALAASGLLVNRIGGRPIKPYQPAGLWQEVSSQLDDVIPKAILTTHYEHDRGEDLYRRSVYVFWKRSVPPPMLSLLDAPNREVCSVRQSRTNTPLQALVMLNDTTFVEAACHLATRMLESSSEPLVRLAAGTQLVLGRPPLPDEQAILQAAIEYHTRYYEQHAEEAESFLGNGETFAESEHPATKRAAYAQVALLILNLDEAVTLR